VVTHHNVLSLLNASQSVFDFSYSDVWSLYHSYSFDFSVWELWGAFSTGGSVVPVSRDVRMSPTLFVQLLGRTGVTVLNVVPSVFKYIVDAYYDAGCPRLELRYIIFGGEMFDRAAAARWLATSSKRPRLVNMYGITETTVHVTAREIDDEELRRSGPTNIGVPLSHLDVMLVDDDLNEVPPMTVGEILVSGDGVASGYYGLPQLTNERFVERNVDGVARRHYRSGDLGRLREDGTYEYLGRADDQVKVLGFRIELGEIEAIMREVPAVCDAAVATTPGPRDDPVLVAIYVADRDEDEALRRLFRERLPRHMVPNRIARVAAIPLAPSGKRDRQAIALLTQTRASSHSVGH
jgi:amino acid adenylation domain-containing protein